MDDELLLGEAAEVAFVTKVFRGGTGSQMGVRNVVAAGFLVFDELATALEEPFTVGRT